MSNTKNPLIENSKSMTNLAAWTINLLNSPVLRQSVRNDRTTFAMAYAALHAFDSSLVPRNKQERTKESRDELQRVLTELERRYGMDVTTAYGGYFYAGMILHEELTETGDFEPWFASLRKAMYNIHLEKQVARTVAEESIRSIRDLIGLTAIEMDIFEFQVLRSDFAFNQLYERVFATNRNADIMAYLYAEMFDVTIPTVLDALQQNGTLRKSGLIRYNESTGSINALSETMVQWIIHPANLEDSSKVFQHLITPLTKKAATSGSIGSMVPMDKELIMTMLTEVSHHTTEKAVNILAYGNPAIDKIGAVFNMLEDKPFKAYVLHTRNIPSSDMAARTYIAQRYLHRLTQETDTQHLLVVENADSVLQRNHNNSFMSSIFGLAEAGVEEDADEQLEVDEILLAENPVPAIWLATRPKSIREENVGRFLFHTEIKPATRADRRKQIDDVVTELNLSEELKTHLSKYQLLSAYQVRSAVRLAEYTAKTKDEAEDILKRGVHQSQRALQRDFMEELRESVTTYSLEYVNTESQFSPEQVMNALKKRPSGTLCLYGMPGTGKTQFAEYLAMQLDKPIIMKRASDILDKFVGGNEKNIAAMFAEAAEEDAILFLDEADSFLRDRSLARAEWSVTQVNELLQQMERFKGIFIVATNLFRDLDAAALRRFTFKFEFKALTDEQRWKMFVTEAKINEANEEAAKLGVAEASEDNNRRLRRELVNIASLTPGDFATVKRQSNLLGETLTPDQWIEQLRIESKAKLAGLERNGMGFTSN